MSFAKPILLAALSAAFVASDAAFALAEKKLESTIVKETQAVTPTVRSIKLRSGLRLEYVEQGDPKGVPVLFLHGFTDSWRSFERILPHLPKSIHAFALTQRGHGDADRPETGYRTRDFAADVAGFMDALELKRAIIVGHSMGSTNALRFAIDYPERTLGLMLVATFATYRGNPVILDFWKRGVSRLTDPIDPAFAREFQQGTVARPVPVTFIDTAVGESLKLPARVWRAAFEGFLQDDFSRELGSVHTPTVVLWGTQDTLAPRSDQDLLLAEISGARLTIYEDAGHALHWEEPERFAADVARFSGSIAAKEENVPMP
jgi:pimeloyl-ACP methyl ester carboxylesterase